MNRIATAVMDGAEAGATGLGVVLPFAIAGACFFAFKAMREHLASARRKQISALQGALRLASDERDRSNAELAAITRVLDDHKIPRMESIFTMSTARRVRVALEKTTS